MNRKGQNTAEYAILIGLVIAAAIGVQTYVKRGIQATMHAKTQAFSANVSTFNPADIGTTTAWGDKYKQWEFGDLQSKNTQVVATGGDTNSIATVQGAQEDKYATGLSYDINKWNENGTSLYQSQEVTKSGTDDYRKNTYNASAE